MSVLASTFRWLKLKRYQYEVTLSLYVLTPTEKFIFSMFPVPQCQNFTTKGAVADIDLP